MICGVRATPVACRASSSGTFYLNLATRFNNVQGAMEDNDPAEEIGPEGTAPPQRRRMQIVKN
jgi:hypothetical protein